MKCYNSDLSVVTLPCKFLLNDISWSQLKVAQRISAVDCLPTQFKFSAFQL